MDTIHFDRTHAEEIAKKESARADMKQHADKLIQGFEKLNETHARRAIWELVQNACDLSEQCEIVINFSNNTFSFSHNGKPFTSKTLISLIKQVSSKSSEKKEDEIGQFGTGFITTHSFGKKIKLTSALKEEGFYVEIKDFLIDRYAKNSDELLEKLEKQHTEVYRLIREGEIIDSPAAKTTFSYLPEYEQDRLNIKQAEDNLHHYIPVVLALNPSLKLVKVIASNGLEVQYRKGEERNENGVFQMPILKNGDPISVFCLKSADNSIQVILPLSEKDLAKPIDDSMAKLFLFFPLIGTENWGCNFIIHSNFFAPTESRDGIHIKSNNEQTQEKEEVNRAIIEESSTLIFNFVECYAESISNPFYLASINFDTSSNTELTNSYYKELKQKWVNKFKTLKLVETEDGRAAPSDLFFLEPSLFEDDSYYDSIYFIASMFWKNQLPKKEIAKKWTEIITEWEDDIIRLLTVEMIAEKIQEAACLSKFNEEKLRDLYEYFIQHEKTSVFEEFRLLPNIKGELIRRGELKLPVNIDYQYIEASNIIIPEIPKQFIKRDFELGLEYNSYNRKKLSDDFNTKILSLTKDLTIESDHLLKAEIRDGLIQLCCIYPSENIQSTRRQIMPIVCKFYNLEYKERIIKNVEEEKFDYDYTPFRALIKIFLLDIVKKGNEEVGWVEIHQSFLKDCLSIITPHKDLKDIIEALPIFPNQNYKLCNQVDLNIEMGFPESPADAEFLKKTYKDSIHDIKKELVHNEFAGFLFHRNELTGLELSSKLEHEFKEQGSYEDIINHPKKEVIFKIIQKITDNNEWAKFFPTIDEKKAIIMMAKISDKEIKNDLFTIIGLEDRNKVAMLGELSRNPQLEKIITLGKKAIEEENRNNADFEFKKKIGIHIEKLVREKIKTRIEAFSVDVIERQGGQDIVVKIEENIVYYVEVKSRWDNNNSITMSNNQIKKAVTYKELYSLCAVEMSDYYPSDGNRYEVKDINDIIDRIRFINDIGNRIEPLISNALSVEGNEEEVKLTDEYRAIIPQPVVKTGMRLDNFVNYLIRVLDLVECID